MKMRIWKVILLLSICELALVWSAFTPEVRISEGRLRGVRGVFGQNRYYSIPYATSNRFQSPKAPPKWEGVLDAVDPFVRCPQKMSSLTTGVENCLRLDVYSPETAKPPDKLPVMVFFHGGAYYKGSKELYDPQFLVIKGAIVVSVNYRLGVLGFLCLAGVSNLGLRDQVAALRWVRRNIAAFGGDPDNVTLCGQSAGASAASLHLLSELSRGLFHRAILLSGSALAPWAFNLEPFAAALRDARKISAASTARDVFDVFSRAPLPKLLEATYDTSVNPRYFKYSPCVDANFTEAFFKNSPYEIIKSGNFNAVPLMIGYTDTEGGFFYRLLSVDIVDDLNKHFSDRLPCVFTWCSEKERRKIGTKMRSYYFGKKPINYWTSVRGLIEYYSDWIAYGSINAYSKVMTQYSTQNVYNFQFSYEGDRDFGKIIAGIGFNGTSHASELFYIFKPLGISLPLLKQDNFMINRLTVMIRNFMKYGNPTPKKSKLLPLRWPPATTNTSNILVINKELSTIERPRRSQRGEFFRNMLCTYGQKGYVPCESQEMCQTT